ncbi:DUF2971 domain-containing protein [Propionispira arboris]|nr:DUF2971 domain-containing protein [Propionispira arboris]
MSFENFVAMIEKQKMYLTRVDCWDDVFEGYLITHLFNHINIQLSFCPEKIKMLKNLAFHCLYAQSWCSDENESDAMWRIYSQNKNGVRVKFECAKIQEDIKRIATKSIEIVNPFAVTYDKQISVNSQLTLSNITKDGLIYALQNKRPAFCHEKEYRFVACYLPEINFLQSIIKRKDTSDYDRLLRAFTDSKGPTLEYKYSMDGLKEVLLDPRAPGHHKETFEEYCKNRDFNAQNIEFGQSKLYTLN